ncbi:hypothetical protein PIROE2DRAFT_2362 [Piromyces sp. E2]|nr:hypothetical protein PIROE2DRAFT_2362 [Piromyces sp. E2]|eukprot:OUM69721.1 hypothetical protein PIROE2DRAFT_2362 [Piromyces sp. E2]
MESNIENLEIALNKNQEYVYVNTDEVSDIANTSKKKTNKDIYDTDETKKEISALESDCNDSILTLNKDSDNDSTQLSINDSSVVNNEDNETNVTIENTLVNHKCKEPEQTNSSIDEYEELSLQDDIKSDNAVSSSSSENLDNTLSNINLNITNNNANYIINNNEEKKDISLKIDTESLQNSPDKAQPNSASSTGSKFSNFVPNFTSLFSNTNKNLRSFSSMYFNKINRISNTESLDSPTLSSVDYGDEEVTYLLERLEEQNNLLQNDPKNSNFETLKANFQAIKNKEKDSDLDWGNYHIEYKKSYNI